MKSNRCTLAHFRFQTDKPATLPHFLGSALRGVMGNQLLQQDCVKKPPVCNKCEQKQECVIPTFFARQDQQNANNTLPNQYVIYHRGVTGSTDEIHFTLKLIGEASQYAEIATKALVDGCAQGIGASRIPFLMDAVTWEETTVLDMDKQGQKKRMTEKNPTDLTLTFDTPLQIRTHQEGVMWRLDFELLMRNILRRLEMLDICHIPQQKMTDLLVLATEIKTMENQLRPYRMMRYSNHTREKKSMSGLVGQISFSGELTPFMPYLRAGALVHIGKACTMGMGHYDLNPFAGDDSKTVKY